MPSSPRPTPRVAIYARQSVGEEQGIRQQLDDCRDEARRRGWHVVAEYPDDDTSGSSARGPKTNWHRMLRDYDAGEFEVVLTHAVDRLTRSLGDVLEIRPPRRDIRIVTVRGGIDTADSLGDFVLKQFILIAENEVQTKTARSKRYAVERRKAGHPAAGRTPYGYRWVRKNDRDASGTRFIVDPSEAEVIRRIYSEFLVGAPLGQIARDLSSDGLRTREGSRWHTPTLRRLLINPHYAALLPPVQPNGQNDLAKVAIEECIPGAWDAIVRLEELLAARGRLVGVKPKHNGTARKWLLSGIALCGVCGKPVRSARAASHPTARVDGTGRAPSEHYAVYRCHAGHFVRKGAIIDEFVKEICIARLSASDAVDLLVPREDGADLAVLHSRRAELESRDSTIAALIGSGKLKPAAAEQALDDLAAELRSVNDQIATAVSADPLVDVLNSGDARAWWDDAATTLARRRAVVESLVTVVIKRVGTGRRVTTLDEAADSIDILWRTGS